MPVAWRHLQCRPCALRFLKPETTIQGWIFFDTRRRRVASRHGIASRRYDALPLCP